MSTIKQIQKVYNLADEIPFGDQSRFVIFSDCHRGDGSGADDFAKNQNIFSAALKHYDKNGFTYIELGDGDELWKNTTFSQIAEGYIDIFKRFSRMYADKRIYLIYGNHDMIKKNDRWVRANLYPLFPGIKVHEGLVLRHKITSDKIFLLHGHQADFFNYELWPLSKFLVRSIWRPLELLGITDPTSASLNDDKKRVIEQKLIEWARQQDTLMIAGHTHRGMFPKPGKTAYFNDGCCVHPRYITAIEIQNSMLSLVKWSVDVREDNALYIKRSVLENPVPIEKYFMPLATEEASIS